MWKKAWKDAVGSKLIAQAIIDGIKYLVPILFLGGTGSYFAGWWPKIGGFLQSTTLPNWVPGILGIFTLFSIVSLINVKIQLWKRNLQVGNIQEDVPQLQDNIKKKMAQIREEAGISIDSPNKGAGVTVPVIVKGHCKRLPAGFQLWTFTIDDSRGKGSEILYWPQRIARVEENDSWSGEIRATVTQSGEVRRFGVFLVGKEGQALISHFKRAGNEMSPKGDPPWTPIKESELTSDLIQCDETREVTLIKKELSRP